MCELGKDPFGIVDDDACHCEQCRATKGAGTSEAERWAKRNPDDAEQYVQEDWIKRFGVTPAEADALCRKYSV